MIKQYGFTLVELVMTIIIVGIMSAYAVPRLGSLATYDLTNAANELVEAIRFAQETSMLRADTGHQIAVNNGYLVQEYNYVTTVTSNVNSPIGGGSSYIQHGDVWDNVITNSINLSFDTRGYPCASVAPCSSHMTATQTITLTLSGETKSITVEPITGYAYVN